METQRLDNKKPVLVKITDLSKKYVIGDIELPALNGVDLEIYEGEFLVLMGPSGSGKTTLLNLIGGIDKASGGTIIYNLELNEKSKKKSLKKNSRHEFDITRLSDSKLTSFRRKYLSYVFQFYSLISTLTAKENVQLMGEVAGIKRKPLKEKSEYWLDVVGLIARMDNFPSQLSGGEIQRVAIARAIVKEPLLLLCDEPTGQLDVKNSLNVVETLANVSKTTHTTVVMVTHDNEYKRFGDRVLYMQDGKIVGHEKITSRD